jgi:hypothetical protein
MTEPTAAELIDRYVQLRDKKRAIEARHKEELSKYNEFMAQLEARLLGILNDHHMENMKTQYGTAYKSLRTSATVTDWPLTLGYIREKEEWSLLEARVSKRAAQDLIEETGQPIPGVETKSEVCVNVRKASEPAGR